MPRLRGCGGHLADLQTAGKIDVEEEFKQSCFHITVYKSYVPARKTGEAAPAKTVARGGAAARDPCGLAG